MTTHILHATGAYGRVVSPEHWLAGKDFRILDGPYFSIRDAHTITDRGYTRICFLDPSLTRIRFWVSPTAPSEIHK